MRRAVLAETRGYVGRSVTPGGFLAFGGLAVVVAWRTGASGFVGTVVAALVALGAAAAFDDPMATVLACSPTSLRARVALRAAAVGLLTVASWCAAVSAAHLAGHDARLLALEPLVLTAIVVAASLRGMARPAASLGATGAAALLVCLALVLSRHPPLDFFPESSHRPAWLVLLTCAAVASWRSSRDPCDERTAAQPCRDSGA